MNLFLFFLAVETCMAVLGVWVGPSRPLKAALFTLSLLTAFSAGSLFVRFWWPSAGGRAGEALAVLFALPLVDWTHKLYRLSAGYAQGDPDVRGRRRAPPKEES